MEELENEIELNRELATKIKVPKDVKEAIYTKIFKNLCISIAIFLYVIFINMGNMRLNPTIFEEDLHVFAGILIVSTIIVFEIAYKKNNSELAMHGVELLVLSVLTLFMSYVFFHRGFVLKFLCSTSSVYIAFYYIIKSIVIYIREVKKYKDGLSDIKEIVEDVKESYLDEKNERKFEEDEEEVRKADSKKEKFWKRKEKNIEDKKIKVENKEENKKDKSEGKKQTKKAVTKKKQTKKVVKSKATSRKKK